MNKLTLLLAMMIACSGCTVVSVAADVVVTTVGVAVDVVDAVTPDITD